MRRITAVITAVITAGALSASYVANQNGVTGKAGDNGGATTGHTGEVPGDRGANGDHTGKAGESK
jgi:hypothetical protein